MTDHSEFLGLAAQAIDFELTRADSMRLETHLASCSSCRLASRALRLDAESLRGFGWYDAPARVEDVVMNAALRGRTRRAPRPWGLALAGALVLAVLVGGTLGGGALLEALFGRPTSSPAVPPTAPAASLGGPTPAASSSTAETAGPATSPSARPSGYGLDLPWVVTSVAATGSGGARMEDVAASKGLVVAVGQDHRDGVARGAVWTSVDGVAWQETILDTEPLHSVAAYDGVFWAAGDNVTASSVDGSTWAWSGSSGGQEGTPTAIAAGPVGVLEIGTAAARSGSYWAVVRPPGASSPNASGSPGGSTLDGICAPSIAAGDSAYVAVGNDCGSDPVRARVFRSGDGRTWQTVDPGDAFGPQAAPVAVAAAGPGFVAGGYWSDGTKVRQAFWSSPDGLAWRRTATFAPPGATEQIRDVAPIGSGAIGVGLRNPGTENTPTAWASPDGLAWARAAPLPNAPDGTPGAQVVNALTSSGGLVVAVGWHQTADGERPVAWAAPAPPGP